MTLSQIAAVISLLLAFGVDQPTVNHVQELLTMPSSKSAIIRVMDTPKEEEVVAPEAPKKSKYSQENVPVATDYTISPNR